VADDELARMQRLLAETEGIYAEFSSVASLVATEKARRDGTLPPDRAAVAVLSSSGLKDVAVTTERFPPIPTVTPDLAALDEALRSTYRVELGAIDGRGPCHR
jgi:threonine synthase